MKYSKVFRKSFNCFTSNKYYFVGILVMGDAFCSTDGRGISMRESELYFEEDKCCLEGTCELISSTKLNMEHASQMLEQEAKSMFPSF